MYAHYQQVEGYWWKYIGMAEYQKGCEKGARGVTRDQGDLTK